jgi:spoIIIJ-associated protein
MSEYQEFTGKTVEEALKTACQEFGVGGLDDLDFEILTPGSRGVLGMGAEPARIVAAARSALGGAAPRREAAEAVAIPAAPPPVARDADDRPADRVRPDRGDRGPRHDRDHGPRREGQRDQERGRVAPSSAPPARPTHHERPDRDHGPHREAGRAGFGLSPREQEQVTAARAPIAVEREEVQAAEASPEALAIGKEILETILGHLGFETEVTMQTGETSKLDVTGTSREKDALGALIGRRGERLSALQHIVNLMLSRRMGTWTRVLVDVEDYRGRRERQLREIATRAADRVEETGKMLQLDAMPALERRWVHLALRGRPGVRTQSIGEEPERRVVILRNEN